jgi:hypothetical protein
MNHIVRLLFISIPFSMVNAWAKYLYTEDFHSVPRILLMTFSIIIIMDIYYSVRKHVEQRGYASIPQKIRIQIQKL